RLLAGLGGTVAAGGDEETGNDGETTPEACREGLHLELSFHARPRRKSARIDRNEKARAGAPPSPTRAECPISCCRCSRRRRRDGSGAAPAPAMKRGSATRVGS